MYEAELIIFVGIDLTNPYLNHLIGPLMRRNAIMADFNIHETSKSKRFKYVQKYEYLTLFKLIYA